MLERINNNITNFGLKCQLFVIFTLILTDLVIILNISPLREIMAFLYFTFIPGILLIQILRLNHLEFIKKILISLGLSLFILIFGGLLLNSLYPLIREPLSFMPVFILFNLIVVILIIVNHLRNKEDYGKLFSLKIDTNGKFMFPIVLALIIPFLSILGTYLMNNYQNNIILLLMLFLIMAYIALIAYFNKKIHPLTYPLAVWLIGLSLLLMDGLTSNHIMGRDIHKEYLCFQLVLSNFHWDAYAFNDTFNACLSITILPTIYKVLSNINGEYIFKLYYAILGSFIPLTLYIIFKKFIDNKYAFFASFLFMSMAFFMSSLGWTRQLIALLFFFLVVLVIFENDIYKSTKKVLILIFMLSVVASHYATAYASFVLIVPILMVPFFKGLFVERKIKLENFDIIFLFFIFILLWYYLVGQIQIYAAQNVVSMISGSGGGTGLIPVNSRDSMVLAILGIGLESIPNKISALVHDVVFASIFIGLITMFWKYKSCIKKLGLGFYFGVSVSMCLLISFIVVPYISANYGAERLFIQTLVFLAPVFVIGIQKIAHIIKRPKLDVLILVVLLLSVFTCNTYLQYHVMGIPHSAYYETNGDIREEYYIYDQEVIGAKWLKNNEIGNLSINTDYIAYSRLMLAYNPKNPNYNPFFFEDNKTESGYVYLGYVNINKGTIYPYYITPTDIRSYNNILRKDMKIYDNGGTGIWR